MEAFLGSAPANLAYAPEETLHGEDVALRKLAGESEGKGAVSTAEIDFESGGRCEQLVRRQAAEVVGGDEFSLFRRARRQLHGRQSRCQSSPTRSRIASSLALDPLSTPPNSITNPVVALWT